jgi:magnesium-transporting ATPase (P-type)
VARRKISRTTWEELFAPGILSREISVELEGDLEIIGATALEDRLQDGVPETLRALKAAGIKVCMITGDKRDTAINIAKACGLISSRKNVYVMLEKSAVGGQDGERASGATSGVVGGGAFVPLHLLDDVAKSSWPREYWLNEVAHLGGGKLHRNISRESTMNTDDRWKFSLVIDGKGLESILANSTSTQQLVDVLTFGQCEAVVFCRVSPKQKGEIVKTVQKSLNRANGLVRRKQERWSTLAIGDGANDVNMIKIANVGVGIAGNEGAQAANNADYAITQFKDLYRLLFVHGRWNYRRTTNFILMFIYKNFACAMCLFWFATVSSFSASTLFESTYLLLFNSVFGIVPLMIFGAIDKDIDPDLDGPPKQWQPFAVTSQYWREMIVPKLYRHADKFSTKTFVKWCLLGVVHSIVPFYFTWGSWEYEVAPIDGHGSISCMWMSSILVYTVEIILVSIVTMYVSASWTKLLIWSTILLNLVAYFLFVFAYNAIKIPGSGVYYAYRIATETMGNVQFWLIVGSTVMISIVPIYWWKQLKKFKTTYSPSFAQAILDTKQKPTTITQATV